MGYVQNIAGKIAIKIVGGVRKIIVATSRGVVCCCGGATLYRKIRRCSDDAVVDIALTVADSLLSRFASPKAFRIGASVCYYVNTADDPVTSAGTIIAAADTTELPNCDFCASDNPCEPICCSSFWFSMALDNGEWAISGSNIVVDGNGQFVVYNATVLCSAITRNGSKWDADALLFGDTQTFETLSNTPGCPPEGLYPLPGNPQDKWAWISSSGATDTIFWAADCGENVPDVDIPATIDVTFNGSINFANAVTTASATYPEWDRELQWNSNTGRWESDTSASPPLLSLRCTNNRFLNGIQPFAANDPGGSGYAVQFSLGGAYGSINWQSFLKDWWDPIQAYQGVNPDATGAMTMCAFVTLSEA